MGPPVSAIKQRYSVRNYTREYPGEQLRSLQDKLALVEPLTNACTIYLVEGETETRSVLAGVIGKYGIISNPQAFLAFVTDSAVPHSLEDTGYQGQQAVLWATHLGLGSCWISGTFKPKKTKELLPRLKGMEKVTAIASLGIPTGTSKTSFKQQAMKFLSARRGKKCEVADLIDASDIAALPPSVIQGLQAVCQAPSALNSQPWEFKRQGPYLEIHSTAKRIDAGSSSRLDCGIAMANFRIAAQSAGLTSNWELAQTDANPIARIALIATT